MAKTTRIARIACDIALCALAVTLMLHMHMSDAVHQVLGVAFGVALIWHLVEHRKWFAALRRGRWSALRIVQTCTMAAILICAIGMLASGLAMSTWVVDAGGTGTSAARAWHLPLVHIGFCLLGLHAGLQIRPPRLKGNLQKVLAAVFALAIVGFAIWSFIDLLFIPYIAGTVGFAFIDPDKSILLGALQYACIFAAFAIIGTALRYLCMAKARSRR